jgi:hypothetical protein
MSGPNGSNSLLRHLRALLVNAQDYCLHRPWAKVQPASPVAMTEAGTATLALDLGTATGFAFAGPDGRIFSGTWNFKPG